MSEIIEGNKKICEFHEGFNNAKGQTVIPDHICKDYFSDDLKYHSSWDWQIPVWGKIGLFVKTIIPKMDEPYEHARWYFGLVTKYEKAVFQNNPESGQKIILELIKWYNENRT